MKIVNKSNSNFSFYVNGKSISVNSGSVFNSYPVFKSKDLKPLIPFLSKIELVCEDPNEEVLLSALGISYKKPTELSDIQLKFFEGKEVKEKDKNKDKHKDKNKDKHKDKKSDEEIKEEITEEVEEVPTEEVEEVPTEEVGD